MSSTITPVQGRNPESIPIKWLINICLKIFSDEASMTPGSRLFSLLNSSHSQEILSYFEFVSLSVKFPSVGSYPILGHYGV